MQSARPKYPRLSSAARLAILLCVLLTTLIAIESLARVMHDRRPATLRIEAGLRDALLIRQAPDQRQLLFAGNSLIYDDLSQSDLQQALGLNFLVHTAGIPGSTYNDWRYGLHALFTRGSQPDVIVFSISPSQFLRGPAATSLPVSRLWNLSEILHYQREQRLNLTQVTELLLEHYSVFFGMRNTFRIYARKFIPGYEPMVHEWAVSATGFTQPEPQILNDLFADKLSKLAAECSDHILFILMFSPTNQPQDEELEPALKLAAQRLGIPIIEPVAEREWPLTQFREDQYHLTPLAAAKFSKLVAADLRQKLADSENRVPGQ